jgi:hypothetical protein
MAPAPKIRALIVTGQNGHDWHATTPVLRSVLEATGKFEVRVTEEFRGADPPLFTRAASRCVGASAPRPPW